MHATPIALAVLMALVLVLTALDLAQTRSAQRAPHAAAQVGDFLHVCGTQEAECALVRHARARWQGTVPAPNEPAPPHAQSPGATGDT